MRIRSAWPLVFLALAACGDGLPHSGARAAGGDQPPASDAGKGSRTVKTETRTVEPFDRVDATGVLDLVVKIGPSQTITVTTDDNLLASVVTETRSKTLRVHTEGDLRPSKSLRVEISTPSLETVRVDGAVAAEIDGPSRDDADFDAQASGTSTLSLSGVRAKSLEVALAGAARLDAKDVRAKKMRIAVDGAGVATVAGAADSLRLDVDGAGKADLSKLAAKEVSVALTGTASAEVDVSQSLDVRASGAATLVYSGNPPRLTKSAPAPAVVKQK